jgi:hypothetical protein
MSTEDYIRDEDYMSDEEILLLRPEEEILLKPRDNNANESVNETDLLTIIVVFALWLLVKYMGITKIYGYYI